MITPTHQIVWSIVSRQPIADLSLTSRQPVADQSQPISNQLAINRQPVAKFLRNYVVNWLRLCSTCGQSAVKTQGSPSVKTTGLATCDGGSAEIFTYEIKHIVITNLCWRWLKTFTCLLVKWKLKWEKLMTPWVSHKFIEFSWPAIGVGHGWVIKKTNNGWILYAWANLG